MVSAPEYEVNVLRSIYSSGKLKGLHCVDRQHHLTRSWSLWTGEMSYSSYIQWVNFVISIIFPSLCVHRSVWIGIMEQQSLKPEANNEPQRAGVRNQKRHFVSCSSWMTVISDKRQQKYDNDISNMSLWHYILFHAMISLTSLLIDRTIYNFL